MDNTDRAIAIMQNLSLTEAEALEQLEALRKIAPEAVDDRDHRLGDQLEAIWKAIVPLKALH